MRLFQLNVTKTKANAGAPIKIPMGIIGAEVVIRFSQEWDGLTKTVVFRAGDVTKDVLNVQDTVVIPAECAQVVGTALDVGVYGTDADDLVAIPTLWATLGTVYDATDPSGDTSTDPSLPIWAQLADRVKDIEDRTVTKEELESEVKKQLAKNPTVGKPTSNGGEIFNFYTDPVYTGDNPPKEYSGNTAAKGSHAQNFGTHADGEYSSASGWNSTASGGIANASGRETLASGHAATTEGWSTKATGAQSHAGGKESEATGSNAFAHGIRAKATSNTSFAIGEDTEASGYYAVASGFKTKASGTCSSANGRETEARQYASSAQGRGTIATARNQSVRGAYNIPDTVDANGNGKYAEIVGGGANTNSRANIYTLDWDGLGWFANGLKIGGTSQNDKNAASVLTTADMATITQAVIAALPRYNGEVVAV